MRHIVLAASLLIAGSAIAPASAQYYGGGYGPPAYEYDPYAPPRRMRSRPSNICITGRGPCPTVEPVPRGWPCNCFIPGFGYKRGNAG